MAEVDSGFALFLNVIVPLLFYAGSQLAMLKVSDAKEKGTHYRFMLIDFTVINAIIFVTSIRELIQHSERYFALVLYGVFTILFVYPSIIALLSKIRRRTVQVLALGGMLWSCAFGSLMYDFTAFFIIPTISSCLGLGFWIYVLVFKKDLPKLRM
jgi:hypothetical protein